MPNIEMGNNRLSNTEETSILLLLRTPIVIGMEIEIFSSLY
ncbi:MAG: hypothetical protein WBQ62_12640 [Dehalococcoidales bacterium]